MNEAQANKQAARQSKTQGARYVVYVPDQGRDIYSAEQARRYVSLIFIEAVYLDGVKVAAEMVTA